MGDPRIQGCIENRSYRNLAVIILTTGHKMSRFECIVGGAVFTTTVEILTSVPDSFFSKALDNTWNSTKASTLVIDRDGTYFQHVLNYLTFGFLPRAPTGRCNISKEVLELLVVEADF